MLHVGDGRICAHHGRDLARIAARGVHHDFRDDGSLLGDDFPFAARTRRTSVTRLWRTIVAPRSRAALASALQMPDGSP
jgi:hypothetical protein